LSLYYASIEKERKTFLINDINDQAIGLMKMLYEKGPDAVLESEEYIFNQGCVYHTIKASDSHFYKSEFDRCREGYKKKLNNVYNIMKRHNFIFSCLDFREFLKETEKYQNVFYMLDPPYVSLIFKYKYQYFNIKDLIWLCDYTNEKHLKFIFYNDEVSKYLKAVDGWKYKEYSINRGGITPRTRLEVLYYRF
jgi:hypothetical protein